MKKSARNCFRDAVNAMTGYTPGEQPRIPDLIKLNTNENPFPPSPRVQEALRQLDFRQLRLYPNSDADDFRDAAAELFGLSRQEVIAGNGSDDVLTITFRAFAAPDRPVAVLDPSYSLYRELAAMQEAPVIAVPLDEARGFSLPEDFLERIRGANLLMLTRPNAPTGNTFPMEQMRRIVEGFDGVVFFDEAYADFAGESCAPLVREYGNVIVSRTLSKSYALAGLRFGFALACPEIIQGMMKLRDSYNADRIAQVLALAALKDQEYLHQTVAQVRENRRTLTEALRGYGFSVVDSAANFVFAMPPDGDGERYFRFLRDHAVLVRYFSGPVTGRYVRITVGTAPQQERLLELTAQYCR